MRRYLSALGVGTFLFVSTAFGASTCTSFTGLPAEDCTAGPFTFSNFSATSFNVANASLFIGGITSTGNSVTLQLNPMLGVTSQDQDVWLQFGVSSTQPVTGITAANGGNPAFGNAGASSIATWICSDKNAGSGGCGPSPSSTLAFVQATGGQTIPASLNGTGNTNISTFENVHVPSGGSLGNFTETFTFGSGGSSGAAGGGSSDAGAGVAGGAAGGAAGGVVAGLMGGGGSSPSNSSAPEPMSLVLIGSGLLGLGVLRRKRA